MRHQIHGLLKEVDAVHPGHPIISQDRGDLLAPQHHVLDSLQRLLSGVGTHDPIVLAVATPQIPGYRA
jgi:hypothetical protein